MKWAFSNLGTLVLLVGSAAPVCAQEAVPEALVTGVVRDAHGVPQLGALIELLGPDASVLTRTFTDDHGRYSLPVGFAGKYQLRASAAFLTPVLRDGLRLRTGMHTVADFTMTALFEAGMWLPAERRSAAQPSDDWRWALRSSGSRPLLRLGDDAQKASDTSTVSSSAEQQRTSVAQGQVTMLAGSGAFGQGGAHQVLAFDRAAGPDQVSVVQADLGDHTPTGNGQSVEVSAGLERHSAFGQDTRLVVHLASHPEIQSANAPGLQVLRSAATEQVMLGDVVQVDAGTLLTAENLLQTRLESAPFLRLAYRMTPEMTIEYRFATDQSLQRSRDLDSVDLPVTALGDAQGRPLLKKGLHQEVSLSRTSDGQVFTIAAYRVSLPQIGVQGSGALQPEDLDSQPILADPSTGAFRYAAAGFTTGGVRVAWKQAVGSAVTTSMEVQTGSSLTLERNGPVLLSDVPNHLRPRMNAAALATVRVTGKRSGTDLEARYRWQPFSALTPVDVYDSSETEAYATVRLRQRIFAGRRLKGVNAVLEATNLLAEGYQPVIAADGETVFLAQVPRSVQGGLAFTF